MGELKDRSRITTSLPDEQIEMLHELSSKTKIPMSKLFEEALEDLFAKYVKRKWHD